MDATQHVVFAAVVLARLVVPLFIPRFPLPAVLLALIIDGVDQTIFQAANMTSVLDNYQSYDKALDIYYLVIAYTSTLRNWPDPAAFRIGQFLWYWRLVGVLIFETSVDGTNWVTYSMLPSNSTTTVTSAASAATGVWTGKAGKRFRVRMTPYTSGTAIVIIEAKAN